MLEIGKREEHLATRFLRCIACATLRVYATVGEFSTNFLLYDA
jgi:hypothetical protein